MSITPWIPAVKNVKDGSEVSAGVVNPIFEQYTQRTQHLYEKFAEFGDKSILIAYDIPILPTSTPSEEVGVYDLVFYNKTVDGEGLALAKVAHLIDANNQTGFVPAQSSYIFGIVKNINAGGQTANVYISGLMELDVDIDNSTNGFIQSDEADVDLDFEPGPYFLSKEEAGKMTRNPGGLAVYVGYAITRRKLLLLPNVNELNQFFNSYKFNILDRAAGTPVLTAGVWTIENPVFTKVGWVGISSLSSGLQALAPPGSKFFYNLPNAPYVDLDTGILTIERTEQKSLARTLPPTASNLTTFSVNGITQPTRTIAEASGIYLVNDLGIWWFSDLDGYQPWAADTPTKLDFTVDTDTDKILIADHGFAIGDMIRFSTTTTLPAPLDPDTDYYVIELADDNDGFTVALDTEEAKVDITDEGTGTHSVYQPYIWKNNKGSDELRPRMSLQFVKFNPNLRESIVTSVTKFNPLSPAVSMWVPDKTAESVSGHGDLLIRLLLSYAAGTAATSSATAIKSLTYNEVTGVTTTVDTPIVSKLTSGNGITIAQASVAGSPVPGSFIISAANSGAYGRVSALEPDGAELVYAGLHSYVSMTTPNILPSSVIGKITLPASIPSADMTFVMLMIGLETLSATKAVEFDFSYAVSKPGNVISSAVVTSVVSFNMPAPYNAKSVFKVGGDGIAVATLKIPAAAFSADSSVNFKLARKTPEVNPLTTAIGLVDIYWKIG